jgi:hypothetical protein
MPRRIDLHTHSTFSDGTSTPAEVVRKAHKLGVEVLLLTDHDTVSGCCEGAEEARKLGLRFAGGVEINTREDDMVHILGYGVDPESASLISALAEFRSRRQGRVRVIVDRLKASGVDIEFEDVTGESLEALGRPHVADALIRKKIVRTRAEAFKKYLAKGAAAYVDPMGPTAEEAIRLISDSGGWAVLAHPFTTSVESNIERWVAAGLAGVEAYYMSHTQPQTQRLIQIANRYNLLMTGGSDYHGPKTGREKAGGVEVPDEVFEAIADRLGLPEA